MISAGVCGFGSAAFGAGLFDLGFASGFAFGADTICGVGRGQLEGRCDRLCARRRNRIGGLCRRDHGGRSGLLVLGRTRWRPRHPLRCDLPPRTARRTGSASCRRMRHRRHCRGARCRRGPAHIPSADRHWRADARCGRPGTPWRVGHASCAASDGRCRYRDGRRASPRSDRSRRRRAAGEAPRRGSAPAARPGM